MEEVPGKSATSTRTCPNSDVKPSRANDLSDRRRWCWRQCSSRAATAVLRGRFVRGVDVPDGNTICNSVLGAGTVVEAACVSDHLSFIDTCVSELFFKPTLLLEGFCASFFSRLPTGESEV